MTRILVVDDDPQLVRALRVNLAARRYEVHTAGDGAAALAVASRHPPDAVILDLGLPGLDGIAVIEGCAAGPARRSSCCRPGTPSPRRSPRSTP